MERLRAIPQRVSAYPRAWPSRCPYCGCGILHKHGEVRKRVKDIHVPEVVAMRYLRVGCKRAFTHYPQGVDRNGRSVRLRTLMTLMWALGLSRKAVGCVLTALGRPASRMSSWRAVQEVGRAAERGMSERAMGGGAPVMGEDETIVESEGQIQACGVRDWKRAVGELPEYALDALHKHGDAAFNDFLREPCIPYTPFYPDQ